METMLLTGATGDIGRELIRQALASGLRVYATVRKMEDEARFEPHPQLRFLTMTVDDRASVAAAFTELDRKLDGEQLKAVVHAAAITQTRTVEFLEPDILESTIKTNTFGTVYVLQESMPRLRGTGGRFIFAGSMLGLVSLPLVGTYAASKHAVEALLAAARRESRGQGFDIVSVRIGAVRSRMLTAYADYVSGGYEQLSREERDLYGELYRQNGVNAQKFDALASSVPAVARRLLSIVNTSRPRPCYSIGKDTRLMTALDRLLPVSWFDGLIGAR